MSYDISKVTPRPWDLTVANQDEHAAIGIGTDEYVIADVWADCGDLEEQGGHNARHIVACVNAHDELVEALENVIRAWDLDRDEVAPDDYERVEKARALLEKVKP